MLVLAVNSLVVAVLGARCVQVDDMEAMRSLMQKGEHNRFGDGVEYGLCDQSASYVQHLFLQQSRVTCAQQPLFSIAPGTVSTAQHCSLPVTISNLDPLFI